MWVLWMIVTVRGMFNEEWSLAKHEKETCTTRAGVISRTRLETGLSRKQRPNKKNTTDSPR